MSIWFAGRDVNRAILAGFDEYLVRIPPGVRILAHVDRCARQVSVDQEAHAELGCWQRMKRLLFSQFTHKSECRSDVVGGDVVFTLYVLECHAAGQAAYNHCYRYAGALTQRRQCAYEYANVQTESISSCSNVNEENFIHSP